MKSHKPYVYTSFVTTIDGKIFVDKPGYWPIGSEADYQRFTSLRAQADVIIDGRGTALKFGGKTIETIHSQNFKMLRKDYNNNPIKYVILTRNEDMELSEALKNPHNFKPQIISGPLDSKGKIDLKQVVTSLYKSGLSRIFIDGGPQLIASLLEQKLINELFITIAPKIFGSDATAVTMVEGKLFSPEQVPQFKVVSLDRIGEEIFIRYKLHYEKEQST